MQRTDPDVQKFYKSRKWQKTQALYKMSQHNLCERCGKIGVIVHHKEHITSENIWQPDITLNFDNLELLCRECHNKEHFKSKSDFNFDNNGNLIVEEKSVLELAGIKTTPPPTQLKNNTP